MEKSKLWQEKCCTHRETHTRLYRIWANMKQRCYNPKNDNYHKYGEKGITICETWKNDYILFRDWALNNGYKDNLTIDRIDGLKGYFPENCRWVTTKVQNHNLRTNVNITYCGQTKCISDWSKETGIPQQTISERLEKGYPLDIVFTKGSLRWSNKIEHKRVGTKKIIITYKGKTQSLYDFAKEYQIPIKTVAMRYSRTKDLEKVFR